MHDYIQENKMRNSRVTFYEDTQKESQTLATYA